MTLLETTTCPRIMCLTQPSYSPVLWISATVKSTNSILRVSRCFHGNCCNCEIWSSFLLCEVYQAASLHCWYCKVGEFAVNNSVLWCWEAKPWYFPYNTSSKWGVLPVCMCTHVFLKGNGFPEFIFVLKCKMFFQCKLQPAHSQLLIWNDIHSHSIRQNIHLIHANA